MPTYVPPKKNTQFIFYGGLVSQADTKLLKSAPTIAAGDFKTALDGGTSANLGTLPTNTPGTQYVKYTLSTTEMNGDNASVVCVDAAGAEWCDQFINIQTAARQIEDLSYPATSGRSTVVDANGLVDSNVVKVGPTGAGTAQTAIDINTIFTRLGAPVGASTAADIAAIKAILPAALTANGFIKASFVELITTALTEGAAGRLKAALTTLLDVAAPVLTVASVNQSGDTFGLANGANGFVAQKAVVDAIKVVTDKFVFTVANKVDSNTLLIEGIDATDQIRDAILTDATRFAGASIAAIKAKTDQLTYTNANKVDSTALVIGADAVDATALATTAVNEIVAAVFARAFSAAYGALTFDQMIKVMSAVLAGVASGMAGNTGTFRNLIDTADVVVATQDASGNRSVVTLTP